MNVTLYVHYMYVKRVRGKGYENVEDFEKDFIEVIKDLCSKSMIDRRYELKNTKK